MLFNYLFLVTFLFLIYFLVFLKKKKTIFRVNFIIDVCIKIHVSM